MDKFTLDCTQLAHWDYVKQPPVLVRNGASTRALPAEEAAAMKSAARLGKFFNPALAPLEEILDIASKPLAVKLLPPSAMSVVSAIGAAVPTFKFSSSSELTGALAFAGSGAAVIGIVVSLGVYASTVREVGTFATVGGGLFFNTPGASLGGEATIILGTPADFSGPYFAVGASSGTGTALGINVLFAPETGWRPSMPPKIPKTLTLMGFAVNYSWVTPTRFGTTVSIEVTDTAISGIKF